MYERAVFDASNLSCPASSTLNDNLHPPRPFRPTLAASTACTPTTPTCQRSNMKKRVDGGKPKNRTRPARRTERVIRKPSRPTLQQNSRLVKLDGKVSAILISFLQPRVPHRELLSPLRVMKRSMPWRSVTDLAVGPATAKGKHSSALPIATEAATFEQLCQDGRTN
jgi:hypothetical protein